MSTLATTVHMICYTFWVLSHPRLVYNFVQKSTFKLKIDFIYLIWAGTMYSELTDRPAMRSPIL